MFHSDDEAFAVRDRFVMDMLEDLLIVDFPSSWFLSTWVIASLKICDFIPTQVDVCNQVSFGNLLVVNIKQDLATRTIDGFADGKCLV